MLPVVGQVVAVARIDGATGALLAGKGCASARTGAGTYTLTLDQPVDALESVISVSSETDLIAAVSLTHISDTVKGFLSKTVVAGNAPTDATLNVVVTRTT